MTPSDTIVAISSAIGQAARIIVRLSGAMSLDIARTLRPDTFSDQANTVTHANISFNQLTVPSFLYTFRAPRSYTGEDLLEFHLPGNPLLARMLVSHCIAQGARLAEPGEFTAMAYFNGRLDLTAAEGVAATIAAHGEAELAAARQLLAGELARRLKPAMDLLADTLALVEVGIDFTEEDVTFLSRDQLTERLAKVDAMLAEIQSTSSRFEKLSHEPKVVLVGPPNAGKSSLLNALARQDRAVVSSIAGTTRDAISAHVILRRGTIELIDVAGIDEAASDIEQQMQSQARRAIETADVVVLCSTDDSPVAENHRTRAGSPCYGKTTLPVRTKADLGEPKGLAVSAITGDGLDHFRNRLDELVFGTQTPGASLALTARHLAAIADARAALTAAGGLTESELIAVDLRECLDALGSILGVIAPDELLGRIFSAFCIGK